MTNELTFETARNLTDAQLLAALATGLSDAADGLRRACVAVCVLREREIDLPVLPDLFRYADDVAQDRLSARAGMTLAAYPFTVKAVLGLPLDMQDRLAAGEKVKVAVKVDGRIRSAERTIFEMSQMQLRIAFTDGKLTPWEEQGEWLLKSGHAEPSAKKPIPPKFSERDGKIVAGRLKYDVEDFMQAFGAAGFQIVPIYKTKHLTPPRIAAVSGSK